MLGEQQGCAGGHLLSRSEGNSEVALAAVLGPIPWLAGASAGAVAWLATTGALEGSILTVNSRRRLGATDTEGAAAHGCARLLGISSSVVKGVVAAAVVILLVGS